MDIVCLDFETYYATDYTLSSLTTEGYVRGPRFHAQMVGIKLNNHPTKAYPAEVLHEPKVRAQIERSAVLCHNAAFDGLILSHHFGLKPAYWFDTLSMARLVIPHVKSHSLAKLAQHFGLPDKMVQTLMDVKGTRDLSPDQFKRLAEYCCHDVELTYDIWKRFLPYVPREELDTIDMTLRMFTEPHLILDRPRLEKYLVKVQARKAEALDRLGVTKGELQSSEQFAELLRDCGVEPPMKESPSNPEKMIYAFSKTDDGMKALLEHPEERVQFLAAARLGEKSTIDETRTARLIDMATRGPAPVFLNYAGAHTLRWSGGDKMNWQNLPSARNPERAEIRLSVMAPPGYVIVVGDLSQIECRMLNHLAGEQWVLDAFREERDLYSEGATAFYGRTITKENKLERHLGKTLELGCFAAETRAVTSTGIKPITKVTLDDRLWDGEVWVTHQGVVPRGARAVLSMAGVRVTPDHLILCGAQWRSAQDVASQTGERLISQALGTGSASLPSPDTFLANGEASVASLSTAKTWETGGLSPNFSNVSTRLSERIPTFDIAYSGPRNRYTIVTDAGPMVVHNCGYGMGASKFQTTCRGGALGGPPIILSDTEAKAAVGTYRHMHRHVTDYWKQGDRVLMALFQGDTMTWGPMTIREHRIYGPGGSYLDYTNMQWSTEKRKFYTVNRHGKHASIWGGTLVENVVQWLSRVVLVQAMLKIRHHLRIVTCTHDEAVCLAPEAQGEAATKFVLDTLRTPPEWCAGIPLDAEGGFDVRYSK